MANSNPEFSTALFDNLRGLINVVDELRDVGLQEYIQLPRIIVVGSQSSGKSSVLENVVGLDFLPRGSGLVTRRPLEMRLVHIPASSGVVKPWAVFEEFKDQKFENFDEVRKKIEWLTDQVAGTNQAIVDKPIVMTIYSNDCPDLTLVDLPGITRIALTGSDQMKVDIEKVTTDMIKRYAQDERTIMLVVVPANADMTTSDGLKLARTIDSEGSRTIGVITKIDIMDKGTDARKMLQGLEVPLKLGYVGVVNRCQQDIMDNMRVKVALDNEKKYFSTHPVYSSMDPKGLGTPALTQKLTAVFFEHIRSFLPKIVKEIGEKIADCEARLEELGPAMPVDTKEKMHLVWEKITEFTENYKNAISGKYDAKRGTNLKSDLSGGAIIKMMFNELYSDVSDKGYKPTKDYSDKDIDRSIILHQGDSIPGFPSIDAFLYLINPLLEKLKEPAQDTLSTVYNYLENLATKLIKKVFAQFPGLIDEINEISSRVIQSCRDKAKSVVDNIIDGEQGYLFTNDAGYLQSKTSLIPKQETGIDGKQIDPKKVFIDELRSRVDVYFNLVVRNMRDSIPKSIGYFLVKQSQEQLQYVLYNEMMSKEESMDKMNEPTQIRMERETIQKTLTTLRKASKVLKRDPNLTSNTKYSKAKDF